MTITKRLMFIVMLAVILPSLVGAFVIYREVRINVESTKLDDLMNIVDAKYIHLLTFLENRRNSAKHIAQDDFIHHKLQELSSIKSGGSGRARIQSELNAYLHEMRESSRLGEHAMKKEKEKGLPLSRVFGRDVKWDMYNLDETLYLHHEIFVMDANGEIIASSEKKHVDGDMSQSPIFLKGRDGLHIEDVRHDEDGAPVFTISAPITGGSRTAAERTVNPGVIGVKIGANTLTALVTGDIGNRLGGKLFFAGYSPSTDFYILNKEGVMITQSRALKGVKNTVLSQASRTTPWQRCVDESLQVREAQEFYPNYAGSEVGGASMCVFDLKWTVVGEQAKDDILAVSDDINGKMIIAGVFTLLIVGLILHLLAKRYIISPIQSLLAFTQEIRDGNYDVKAPVGSDDELGRLTSAFNDMAREMHKATEELLSSKTYVENILNSIAESIIVTGVDHKVVYVNYATLEMLGYGESELIGLPITDIMVGAGLGRRKADNADASILGTGVLTKAEMTYFAKDGKSIPVLFSDSMVNNRQGVPQGIACIAIDITEREEWVRRLERSEATLAKAQAIANMGHWERDIADEVIDGSMQFFSIFGLSPDLIGHTYESFLERVHPEDRREVDQKIEAAITYGNIGSFEHRIVRPDGAIRVVSESAEIIRDSEGVPAKLLVIVQDVTDRKKTEKELIKKEASLQIARENSRLKDEFLASMSHELRSPLAAVIGFAERIPVKLEKKETEKAIEFSQKIADSAVHLRNIINDLLDYAKIEAGKTELHLEYFTVRELIDQISSRISCLVEEKNLAYNIDAPDDLPPIYADRVRFAQIIINLVSNAVKFTPAGGSIRVIADGGEGSVLLCVQDTGIGIAPEDHAAVFEKFKQVGRSKQEQQGTGLGLAITKKLVELHGGNIWVESEYGKGAKFCFTLPAGNAVLSSGGNSHE